MPDRGVLSLATDNDQNLPYEVINVDDSVEFRLVRIDTARS
jgi:hypothetical protein